MWDTTVTTALRVSIYRQQYKVCLKALTAPLMIILLQTVHKTTDYMNIDTLHVYNCSLMIL